MCDTFSGSWMHAVEPRSRSELLGSNSLENPRTRLKSEVPRVPTHKRKVRTLTTAILSSSAGQNCLERGNDSGVELCLNAARQPDPSDTRRHRIAILPLRRHSVVGIR